jgi:hypothetical protein
MRATQYNLPARMVRSVAEFFPEFPVDTATPEQWQEFIKANSGRIWAVGPKTERQALSILERLTNQQAPGR